MELETVWHLPSPYSIALLTSSVPGQYTEIRQQEIVGIRNVYQKIFDHPSTIKGLKSEPFKPKITALVVTKLTIHAFSRSPPKPTRTAITER